MASAKDLNELYKMGAHPESELSSSHSKVGSHIDDNLEVRSHQELESANAFEP